VFTRLKYPDGHAVLYGLGGDGTRVGEKEVGSFSGELGPGGYGSATNPTKNWTYTFGAVRGDERRGAGGVVDDGCRGESDGLEHAGGAADVRVERAGHADGGELHGGGDGGRADDGDGRVWV